MKQRVGPIDHDVGDVVARQQRLERPEAEHVVADVVEQVLLLGDRQDEILDRHDFVDDVANFLARALGIELGQRRQIDRLDQRAEDHRLGLKIAVRPALRLRRTTAGSAATDFAASGLGRGRAGRGRRLDTQSGIGTLTEHTLLPCVCGRYGADRGRRRCSCLAARLSSFLSDELGDERIEQAALGFARYRRGPRPRWRDR